MRKKLVDTRTEEEIGQGATIENRAGLPYVVRSISMRDATLRVQLALVGRKGIESETTWWLEERDIDASFPGYTVVDAEEEPRSDEPTEATLVRIAVALERIAAVMEYPIQVAGKTGPR